MKWITICAVVYLSQGYISVEGEPITVDMLAALLPQFNETRIAQLRRNLLSIRSSFTRRRLLEKAVRSQPAEPSSNTIYDIRPYAIQKVAGLILYSEAANIYKILLGARLDNTTEASFAQELRIQFEKISACLSTSSFFAIIELFGAFCTARMGWNDQFAKDLVYAPYLDMQNMTPDMASALSFQIFDKNYKDYSQMFSTSTTAITATID